MRRCLFSLHLHKRPAERQLLTVNPQQVCGCPYRHNRDRPCCFGHFYQHLLVFRAFISFTRRDRSSAFANSSALSAMPARSATNIISFRFTLSLQTGGSREGERGIHDPGGEMDCWIPPSSFSYPQVSRHHSSGGVSSGGFSVTGNSSISWRGGGVLPLVAAAIVSNAGFAIFSITLGQLSVVLIPASLAASANA